MPDITLVVRDFESAEDAERLERSLIRLEFVEEVGANTEAGLLAISYQGGSAELEKIEQAIRETGHDFEHSPGADQASE